MTMRGTVVLLTCLFAFSHEVNGFTPRTVTRRNLSVRWNSKLFGPDEDEGKELREGEALAKQFYEQMRKREEGQSTAVGDESQGSKTAPSTNLDAPEPKKKKFTGAPESANFGNDARIFSSTSGMGGGQGPRSPREQMMQREFELVGRAEKGLAFQAVLAVAVGILYLYVGLSGGIQSGGDYDLGVDETIADEIVLPTPRDTEASYWL